MEEGDASIEWLYDYIVQFLKSPGWRIPIMSFIDEHCIIFDNEDENKFIYTEVHNQFKDMIDNLLENLLEEIGVTANLLLKVCEKGLKNRMHHRIFEQILACDNFLSFKKLMIKRNKELEVEAMEMLQKEGFATEQEFNEVKAESDEAEIEAAVALSIALEEERKQREREEQEELERAIRESEEIYKAQMSEKHQKEEEERKIIENLKRVEENKVKQMEESKRKEYEEKQRREVEIRRKEEEEAKRREEEKNEDRRRKEEIARKKVMEEVKQHEEEMKRKEVALGPLRKKGEVNLQDLRAGYDVSAQKEESKHLEDTANEILKKNELLPGESQEAGVESLAQRQARLKKQRDLLLARKKQERESEFKQYLDNGGSDYSQKKDSHLPPVVSEEELEKRRNIVAKLKETN
ncbi:CFAP36_2 [Blepharisma stoltei]|uniref:Cilia- and flagella-associated protein 36 n=1 Tax=Blepharisma stoltei TaxID=1481888 RepID=A0AAU9KGT2_9CILI|nr:unnamed protein product [Blepharisma stoltei]